MPLKIICFPWHYAPLQVLYWHWFFAFSITANQLQVSSGFSASKYHGRSTSITPPEKSPHLISLKDADGEHCFTHRFVMLISLSDITWVAIYWLCFSRLMPFSPTRIYFNRILLFPSPFDNIEQFAFTWLEWYCYFFDRFSDRHLYLTNSHLPISY